MENKENKQVIEHHPIYIIYNCPCANEELIYNCHYTGRELSTKICPICVEWRNLVNSIISSVNYETNYWYELPPHCEEVAYKLIKYNQQHGLNFLREGKSMLTHIVWSLHPYWCAFLVVVCDVDISAADIAADKYLMAEWKVECTLFGKKAAKCRREKHNNISSYLRQCIDNQNTYPTIIISSLYGVNICSDIAKLILSYIPKAPRFWPSWAKIDSARGY